MDIVNEKYYEILQIKYLKSLTNITPINKDVKDIALKSVVNMIAKFLDTPCKHCNVMLVDPIGIKIYNENNKPSRNAYCGNCGYSSIVSFY